MSVRVVARIRPLLKGELEKDMIIRSESSDDGSSNVVRIPNPKNHDEDFTFQFNEVYDSEATQEEIFQSEVAPTIKHLFKGFDVTLFAYGVTGTGKTHTMRGGKSLADRGVIPRMLSGIYRRSRKMEKDSDGATSVQVSMSYYEIYNDRVFDLFEPPEKRTPTGLPLREQHGKTVVVGLTERPCSTLKDFERLYDQANVNRSTSATKLNAHSSRSHAILRVKVAVTTGDETRISTASAIDLAGSEDNRRTDNVKDRLVESASINKSLFVLAQCVEAITKKQNRIPYRESKMTRILSLGQNNGLTVMILNLAPVRSYHLDSLSSLNFANRTKKIEIKEIENEPIFKGQKNVLNPLVAASAHRRPLQLLAHNEHRGVRTSAGSKEKEAEKPRKAFAVYSDQTGVNSTHPPVAVVPGRQTTECKKRKGEEASLLSRPAKTTRQTGHERERAEPLAGSQVSKADIEELIERKVQEALAARALSDNSTQDHAPEALSENVQRRLDALERRIEQKEEAKSEGLTYLLMAKQHHVRGEDASSLKMYQLAQPYYPENQKLANKIQLLEEKLRAKPDKLAAVVARSISVDLDQKQHRVKSYPTFQPLPKSRHRTFREIEVEEQQQPPRPIVRSNVTVAPTIVPSSSTAVAASAVPPALPQPPPSQNVHHDDDNEENNKEDDQTPRTQRVLQVINTRDLAQIKLLKGVGAKKAEGIVAALGRDDRDEDGHSGGLSSSGLVSTKVTSLAQLARMKGVGVKTVESMRVGIC
ncbi:MAG: hypothetical protein M1823_006000 [Watsoniomyces obsoletus]|nr:MAG: hypothetical protein M1823_006000 [Watsoniomyces obsoletus]